jgi:hypothetical protein
MSGPREHTEQNQFEGLRLLRRYSPRNDVRAVGSRNSGPPRGGRGKKNAKQSQFPRAGISAKSFARKGLRELLTFWRIGKTKPICLCTRRLGVGRASPLAQECRAGTHDLQRSDRRQGCVQNKANLPAGRINVNSGR